MKNGYFHIAALFCIILLNSIFFYRKKVKNIETKLYGYMLISSLLDTILELTVLIIAIIKYDDSIMLIIKILNKIDFIHFIIWPFLLLLYVICITKNEKIYKKFAKIGSIISLIAIITELLLPINLINEGESMGVSGACTSFILTLVFIFVILTVSFTLFNIKKAPNKKYLPIYMLLLMIIIGAIVRTINPTLLIMPAITVYIDLIMFFTIENPDVKMLEEIEKNRELTEKSIEDKANMLFKITEDVKTPVSKIEMLSNKIIMNDELEEIHNDAKSINSLSRSVNNTINNVMDITNYDIANLKVSDISYDMYTLFKELVIMTKEKLNDNIDFSYHVSSTIPNKLYGDFYKIKQIIFTIIMNAIKYTKEGTIDLNIESINRGDVCRLIIEVSDTGCGMDAYKINEIIEADSNLSEDEINKIKDLNVDLKITKKMIDMLGGSLLIKSEEGKGSTFTIIINQKIVDNTYEKKNINILSNKKKCLVICDDYQDLEKLSLELKKNNYLVSTSLYGMDLVKEINNNYDLIFIDDEMKPHNAVEIMKEIGNTKEKIIIMLNKDKESIKEHYLEDYSFTDYLLKDNYKEEIKRIKDSH